MRNNSFKNLGKLALFILMFAVSLAYAEPGGGTPPGGGDQGKKEEGREGERPGGTKGGGNAAEEEAQFKQCEQGQREIFEQMGKNMRDPSIHHAFKILFELDVHRKVAINMAESFFCHLSFAAKSWDGTTLPYTITHSFSEGRKGRAATGPAFKSVEMKFEKSDDPAYETMVTIKMDGTEFAVAKWKGNAKDSAQRTSGSVKMKDPHALNGGSGKSSQYIVWDRSESTEDEKFGRVNSVKFVSMFSHESSGEFKGGSKDSNGMVSHVMEGEYRKSADGKIFGKFNRVESNGSGGTRSFQAVVEQEADGKCVISINKSESGGLSNAEHKGVHSDMITYEANCTEKKIISEKGNNHFSGNRYGFNYSPKQLAEKKCGEDYDKKKPGEIIEGK